MTKITVGKHELTIDAPLGQVDGRYGVVYRCRDQQNKQWLLHAMSIKAEDSKQATFYATESGIIVRTAFTDLVGHRVVTVHFEADCTMRAPAFGRETGLHLD